MPVTLKMAWAPSTFLDFAEAAENELRQNGEAALPGLINEFRTVFTQCEALAAMFNRYLEKVAEEPAFHGDGTVGSDLLTLWYSEHLALRLVKERSDITSFGPSVYANVITNFPGDTLLLYLGKTPGWLTWYRLVEGASFDRFDATLAVEYDGKMELGFGSVVHIDSRLRFPHIEESADSLWLVMTGRPSCSQIVSFDGETLQPRGASMSSEVSSVLCTMLDIVRLRAAEAPERSLGELASHADHHVRWAAVRAMWRHDRAKAIGYMEQIAFNDPHPFVRKAAKASMDKLEAINA